jgi:hypothetical protein
VKEHWFLSFMLAWFCLQVISRVLTNLLIIFQRRPATLHLTDEQFETIRSDVASRLADHLLVIGGSYLGHTLLCLPRSSTSTASLVAELGLSCETRSSS